MIFLRYRDYYGGRDGKNLREGRRVNFFGILFFRFGIEWFDWVYSIFNYLYKMEFINILLWGGEVYEFLFFFEDL